MRKNKEAPQLTLNLGKQVQPKKHKPTMIVKIKAGKNKLMR